MLNNRTKEAIEARAANGPLKPLTLGVLSDTRPVNGHIWKEMLDELMVMQRPDIFVNGGDFTDWSRKSEYRDYYNRVQQYGPRSLHVIGNHDDRFFGPSYFRKYFGDWVFIPTCPKEQRHRRVSLKKSKLEVF